MVRGIKSIALYDEGTAEALDMGEITRYLAQKMRRVKVEARGNPFALNLPRDRVPDYAKKIASTKIQGVSERMQAGQEPLYGEIEYEKRRIQGSTSAFGVLYDGFHLLRLFYEIMSREERRPELVHIFFTNRLLATWDDGDKRYHLRTSVFGIPSIVSTTGIIEAPARPKEYYLLKQHYERLGKDLTQLNDSFQGSFIGYEDSRLTEVAKGYAMQAVFYYLIGDPFCEDKGCRLYNAHWQEELIFAQLESGYEFCPRHNEFLDRELAS